MLAASLFSVLPVSALGQLDTGGIYAVGKFGMGQSASSAAPIRQIAGNGIFMEVLRSDGTVVCWGDNAMGECNVPPRLSGVTQVSCGGRVAGALMSNGTVRCWGDNSLGQCNVPTGLSGVVQIAVGPDYVLALKSNGLVVGWGKDSTFQVYRMSKLAGIVQIQPGLALRGDFWVPGIEAQAYDVQGHAVGLDAAAGAVLLADGTLRIYGPPESRPPLTGVVQASGPYALLSNGTVATFGYAVPPPPGLTAVVQVLGTNEFGAALKSDGSVIIWTDSYLPVEGYGNLPKELANVVTIASADKHSVLLKADHTVVCRGNNSAGESTVPAGLTGVVQVAAGNSYWSFTESPFSMALKSNGTVVCWGDNRYGQRNVPIGLAGVSQISAGGQHCVALKSNGTVTCWGGNLNGQIDVPAGVSGIKAVSGGGLHTLALKTNGNVIGWGGNSAGQLNIPSGLAGVIQVAAGTSHSVALKSDGTVVCWGDNTYQQCSVPAGLAGVVQISAGDRHTVARKSNGAVVCWGDTNTIDQVRYGETVLPPGLISASDAQAGYGITSAVASLNVSLPNWLLAPGAIANATVFLPKLPGAAGADIVLKSDDPLVSVPSTLHLNSGVQTGAFPIKVSASASVAVVKISATYLGQVATTLFRVSSSTTVGSIAPVTQYSGRIATPTVLLESAMPSATVFTVTTDNAAVKPFRASLLVPAGTDSFPVLLETKALALATTAHFTVSHGSVKIATGTVNLVPPLALTISTPSVTGGTVAVGTVTLPYAATSTGANGMDVNLTSSNPNCIVPATVNIPDGQFSATFDITTKAVDTPVTAVIRAFRNTDPDVPAKLTVALPVITSISATPSVLVGDNTGSILAALKGPAGPSGLKVTLSSSSTFGNVPTSVIVPAGATSASINFTPKSVAAPLVVTLHGVTGSTSATTTFKINPVPNHIVSIKIAPTSVVGPGGETATITFSGPSAPTGTTVVLKSIGPISGLPPTVNSAPSAISVTVYFSSSPVDTKTIARITGTTGGNVSASGTVSVNPATLNFLTIVEGSGFTTTTYPMRGGDPVNLGIALNGVAGPSGVPVTLTSSDPTLVAVPSTYTVPSGFFRKTVGVMTTAVTSAKTVTVTANRGAIQSSVTLNLLPTAPNPATLEGLQAFNNPVQGGTTAYIGVFSYGATANGFTVSLTSSDPIVAPVPATLLIGQTVHTTEIFVNTTKVTLAKTITITAKQGSITKTVKFQVTP